MMRAMRLIALAFLPVLALGCQNLQPAFEAPSLPNFVPPAPVDNPIYVPLPKDKYGRVYMTLLEVLYDYGFEIADTNRFSGHIEAVPRTAPGILLPFKSGSPEIYDRLLCTLQSYRHRLSIKVLPADPQGADHGGYFVEFIAKKELEDVATPLKSTVGNAVFRTEPTVDRRTEVIDANYFDQKWIFRGRDTALEQELIRRYRAVLARPE